MDDKEFRAFLLHEYDKCYELFKMHYDASGRLFRYYLIILGGFFTIISLSYEYFFPEGFDFFKLGDESLILLFSLSLLLLCIFFMIVEHKIKTIYYVRVLNNIRKYFSDNTTDDNRKYISLPISTDFPKYFTLFEDFFWEISFFAFVNSSFFCIFIINKFNLNESYCFIISLIIFLSVTQVLLFWLRGKKQEKC